MARCLAHVWVGYHGAWSARLSSVIDRITSKALPWPRIAQFGSRCPLCVCFRFGSQPGNAELLPLAVYIKTRDKLLSSPSISRSAVTVPATFQDPLCKRAERKKSLEMRVVTSREQLWSIPTRAYTETWIRLGR